jgi:hypothetical protein
MLAFNVQEAELVAAEKGLGPCRCFPWVSFLTFSFLIDLIFFAD